MSPTLQPSLLCFILWINLWTQAVSTTLYDEQHRPQLHYSPSVNWMNDPNGLIYYKSVYHLFYQYDPNNLNPRSKHMGHAVSKDLIHWKTLPIALYPNSLGTIFSGFGIVDPGNVTGLQTSKLKHVLIMIFTQHLEQNGQTLERQSLAYSNDDGYTWSLYPRNPVLDNPGIQDYRDPKIFEYDDYFVMAVAAGNRIIFYRSENLIDWSPLSEFGENEGSHGGVWECPDLFPLRYNGQKVWVLIVSINPGGPNRGSATQYFIGYFDGKRFVNYNLPATVRWIDYGPDSYAGVTWVGVPKDRIFISWLNNWDYARSLPTTPWRGQMTLPRKLTLSSVDNQILIVSTPVGLKRLKNGKFLAFFDERLPPGDYKIITSEGPPRHLWEIHLVFDISDTSRKDILQFCLFNSFKEEFCAGFNSETNRYFIDRSKSGNVTFNSNYTRTATAPRFVSSTTMEWLLIVDVSSLEFFADGGLTVMTSLFFPTKVYDSIVLRFSPSNQASELSSVVVKEGILQPLRSIWKQSRNPVYFPG